MERLRLQGLDIACVEDNGTGLQRMLFVHRPIWGFIHADAKAREKILQCFPEKAIRCGFYCWQLSSVIESKSGKRRQPRGWFHQNAVFRNEFTGEEFYACRSDGVEAHKYRLALEEIEKIDKLIQDAFETCSQMLIYQPERRRNLGARQRSRQWRPRKENCRIGFWREREEEARTSW